MNTPKHLWLVRIIASLSCLPFTVGCPGNGGEETGSMTGFSCGPTLVCSPATQYCSVQIGGPAGTPPTYACVDVSGATPPTCENIGDVTIGCECVEAGGGVTVTCTAP